MYNRWMGAVAAAALVLSGCSATPAGPSTSTGDRPLTVVAAFYPLQFVAERVGGSHVKVTNLTKPGAEPHDLEVTPSQIGALATADLVFYQSKFQPTVDQAVASSGTKNLLDASVVVPQHPAVDDQGNTPDARHAHGDLDPHTWLDPHTMAAYAPAVAAKLSAADPAHQADYDAGAAALVAEMRALDADFSARLATCQRREFVTSHAAFGYLAQRYNLDQIAISGLSPDAEPSAARIAEIHELVTSHGITTIFYETLASPGVAKSIAGDLKLKVDVLDPLEGLTPASRGADYTSVMKANVSALASANGCS